MNKILHASGTVFSAFCFWVYGFYTPFHLYCVYHRPCPIECILLYEGCSCSPVWKPSLTRYCLLSILFLDKHCILRRLISIQHQGLGAVNMESRPCVNSVMTVGWLHWLYNNSWKCNNLAAEQFLPKKTIRSSIGGADQSSQYKSHLPGNSSPPAKLSGTPCKASPRC